MKEKKEFTIFDRIGLTVFLVLCLLGAVQVWKYLSLSIAGMALTALLLEALFMLAAWAAWQGRMPFLLFALAAGVISLTSHNLPFFG